MSDVPRSSVPRRWRRQGAGRCRGNAGGVDELGDAREPTVVPGLGGLVPQQLLSHEQSSLRSWLAVTLA